jgi:5-methyltetrahydropteroyltriglutamate--homocysteine methyltransferase
MAHRDRPPFRADHVGSLLRPPQCGFSSTVEGNALTRGQQAAKLRLVVEVADDVWG